MKEKLLKILNELPTGDYIRIRDNKHVYIGRIHKSDRLGHDSHFHIANSSWPHFTSGCIESGLISLGDTLYRTEDITEVKVKPLIYL